MVIEGFMWLPDIVDKLENKHQVTIYEVESLFEKKTREAFVISARGMSEKERNHYARKKR